MYVSSRSSSVLFGPWETRFVVMDPSIWRKMICLLVNITCRENMSDRFSYPLFSNASDFFLHISQRAVRQLQHSVPDYHSTVIGQHCAFLHGRYKFRRMAYLALQCFPKRVPIKHKFRTRRVYGKSTSGIYLDHDART